MIEKFFKFKEMGTSLKTEVVAGTTTFMTMAYIIFVQPSVLSQANMDFGAIMVATCLSSMIATLIMGIYANYPIALAPGMGENFFFAFTIIIGMGIAWQKALGATFIAGILFLVITLFKFREMVIDALPESLKSSIAGGIGLFIGFIGLVQGGIIEKNPSGIISLGNVREKAVLICIAGLIIISILMAKKIKGAILIGMIITALIGIPFGLIKYYGIFDLPPSLSPTFFKFDIKGVLNLEFIPIIIVLLFMDVFDTVGTLIGVGQAGGFMKNGKLPRANRALISDAVGTVVGAAMGTSTVTSYIESTTGISEGGRTGFASVITAFLFIISMFFYPIVKMIGGGVETSHGTILYPITAPALIIVGSLMLKTIVKIKWDDPTEAIPCFLALIGMPLTYSIADGLAFGFISYPLVKLLSGKGKEVSWLVYLLGIIFILRYAFIGK